VRKFANGPIGASVVLWYLGTKIDIFKHRVMEMKYELNTNGETLISLPPYL
jgi:hypothetical protein